MNGVPPMPPTFTRPQPAAQRAVNTPPETVRTVVLGMHVPINTVSGPARLDALAAPKRELVGAQFLTGLAEEQRRYLSSLGELGSGLPGHAADLPVLAAGHARLAREFLDAQRAILRRRAETAADVAAIVSTVVGQTLPPPAPAGRVELALPDPVPSEPDATSSSAIADMVDRAFEDPTATSERELRELLDGWWARECEEGRALLADAHARAAAARHLGPPQPAAPAEPPLPVAFAGALDGAESLGDLLDTLLRVLDSDESRIGALDAEATEETPAVARDARDAEHFDRFWKGGSAGHSRGSVGNWLLIQVLFPMVSLVSVLALVLAVVG